MPNFTASSPGMPIWVDVSVETTEQREALASFYAALHGWSWDVGSAEMGHYSIATVRGAPVMGLGQGPGGSGLPVPYFLSEDIKADTKRAIELGGIVLMGPMVVPGQGSMTIVEDPTGATHGLWQPAGFPGFGVAYEPGTFGWIDHASPDPQDAVAYYSSLLNKSVIEPEPGMAILADGEQWFASLSAAPDAEARGAWMPIYVVADLVAFRAHAKSLGASVIVEEVPVPGTTLSILEEPVCHVPFTVMQAGDPSSASEA